MVYMLTRRQVITLGPSGDVIDVSIPAIQTVMDLHRIKFQKECMAKVVDTFHYFLNKKEG